MQALQYKLYTKDQASSGGRKILIAGGPNHMYSYINNKILSLYNNNTILRGPFFLNFTPKPKM